MRHTAAAAVVLIGLVVAAPLEARDETAGTANACRAFLRDTCRRQEHVASGVEQPASGTPAASDQLS